VLSALFPLPWSNVSEIVQRGMPRRSISEGGYSSLGYFRNIFSFPFLLRASASPWFRFFLFVPFVVASLLEKDCAGGEERGF
jgi:hypothetical protein